MFMSIRVAESWTPLSIAALGVLAVAFVSIMILLVRRP